MEKKKLQIFYITRCDDQLENMNAFEAPPSTYQILNIAYNIKRQLKNKNTLHNQISGQIFHRGPID